MKEKLKAKIQSLKHYFYAAKDGVWYIGYHKDVPPGHKWFSYYSLWHDGNHRAVWIWRFTIANFY